MLIRWQAPIVEPLERKKGIIKNEINEINKIFDENNLLKEWITGNENSKDENTKKELEEKRKRLLSSNKISQRKD
jgi:hypothetical protein